MASDTPLDLPFSLSDDRTKNKSKKHSRQDVTTHTSHSDSPKNINKKRKHHDTTQNSSKRKKRKQKQNDKAHSSKMTADMPSDASSVPQQVPPEPLDEEAQASAAALLSAILSLAATGAPDMMSLPATSPQMDLNYPPPIPSGQHHFVPMGAEHTLSYLSNPHMQPISDPTLISNMDLPIADLSSGSNEDVLRALQDLDITKIAGVLKTLGDVAANSPSLSIPPPSHSLHPPAISPSVPISSYPAPSNAILGMPPKAPPPVGAISPICGVPEQHGNPEHAILLATKWLGTAKLAELVRTEGV